MKASVFGDVNVKSRVRPGSQEVSQMATTAFQSGVSSRKTETVFTRKK